MKPKIPDVRLYMQYIGTLTLMGSLLQYQDLSDDGKARIDAAFADANRYFKKAGSDMRFVRCTPGSYGPAS